MRVAWLFILICYCSSCSKNDESDVVEFLKLNNTKITIGNDESTITNFLSIDLSNNVYLLGEYHGTAMNTSIQLHFFKALQLKVDVPYLLTELGYAAGQLLNQYIETGDENRLNQVINALKGSVAYTYENKDYYKELRNYWLNKPNNRKFKIVGTDIEHQSSLALLYLKQLSENRSDEVSKQILAKTNYNNKVKEDQDWATGLINKINQNIPVQDSIRLEELIFVLQNMVNASEYYINNFDKDTRENAIWQNTKTLIAKNPNSKYFGQWGLSHVLQKSKRKTLVNFLQHDNNSPVKGKVLSIGLFYDNCEYILATGNKSKFNTISYRNILDLAQSDLTFFRLTQNDSPFEKDLIFDFDDSNGGVTTDYFKYMLLVKNSPSMNLIK
jgi:hypothetical protein